MESSTVIFPSGTSHTDASAAWIAAAARPDARRSGEVKPAAADITPRSAGRAERSSSNGSAPPGTPEPADSGGASAVKGRIAFTGLLEPVAADAEAPSPLPIPASPQGPAHEMGSGAANSGDSVDPCEAVGATPVSPAGAAAGDRADTPGSQSDRGTDPTVSGRSREPALPAEASPQAGAANPSASNLASEAPRSESAGEASAQPGAARLAREPEAAAPQKVARDITLELDSGSQRAAVRLVERGGEVHVAVRTPDAGLAADLRQGLPSLTAKLEQIGFRTETWHPGSAALHPAEASAGGAPQDRSSQGGQESFRDRREGQPQPAESGQRPQPKKEGKDFAWFMSSLG